MDSFETSEFTELDEEYRKVLFRIHCKHAADGYGSKVGEFLNETLNKLWKASTRPEPVQAWLEHVRTLFEPQGLFTVRYYNSWYYQDGHFEPDMYVFRSDGYNMGLLKAHYVYLHKNPVPHCMVEFVQGNRKVRREVLERIHNLRTEVFAAFLTRCRPLIEAGWNVGIANAHPINRRLRDRFCSRETMRPHRHFLPSCRSADYWLVSDRRTRVREILRANEE